jgi:hypothetical protein
VRDRPDSVAANRRSEAGTASRLGRLALQADGVEIQAAMSKIVASLVAGLGLFFLGLHLLGNHLKQASSRKFRSLIARFTDRVWRGSLLGLLAGVFTQCTSAVE